MNLFENYYGMYQLREGAATYRLFRELGTEIAEMEYRRGCRARIESMTSVDIEADMFWNISLSSVPVSEFLL